MSIDSHTKGFRIGFFIWVSAQAIIAATLLLLPEIRARLVGTASMVEIIAWGIGAGVALVMVLLPGPLQFVRTIPLLGGKTAALRFGFFLINSASEEIIWRGGSFYLSGRIPFAVLASLASVGFAAVHFLPQGKRGFYVHFGTGIIFSLVAAVSGGLLAPFIAHLMYNLSLIGKIAPPKAEGASSNDGVPSEIPAVQFKSISKSYDKTIGLQDVSFSIFPGELVALLGQNGAGKTSLLEILVGLRTADSGSVEIHGYTVVGRSAIQQHSLGIILQDNRLPPKLTVEEILNLFSSFAKQPMPVAELIERFQLHRILKRYSEHLSGGERQIVSLAIASFESPKLLILDEPTNALDPRARQVFWKQVRALRERGCAVLFATHQIEEAQELSSRVIILQQGRIIADGATMDLRASTSTKFKFRATFNPVTHPHGEARLPVPVEAMEVAVETVQAGLEMANKLTIDHHTMSSFGIERPSLRETYFELTGEPFDK